MRFQELLESSSDRLYRLIKTYSQQYNQGEIDLPTLKSKMKRAQALMSQDLRQKRKIEKIKKKYYATRNYARKVLKNRNAYFVSIDMEWDSKRIFEVGVTTSKSFKFDTITYYVKESNNRPHTSIGSAQYLEMSEVQKIIHQYARECDFLVGHSLDIDAQRLGINLKSKPYFDTALLGMWFTGNNRPSLYSLAQHYGFNFEWHRAGNDSYYTLKLLFALAEDIVADKDFENRNYQYDIQNGKILTNLTRSFLT